MKTTILGIRLKKRLSNSTELQKLLSKYGCMIKTRLGLHSISQDACSPDGIILLEIMDFNDELDEFKKELGKLEGLTYETMSL